MTEERPPTAEEIQILRDNLNEHIAGNGSGSKILDIVTENDQKLMAIFFRVVSSQRRGEIFKR